MEKHRSPVVKSRLPSAKNTIEQKRKRTGTGTESNIMPDLHSFRKVEAQYEAGLAQYEGCEAEAEQRFSLEEKR